MVYGSQSKPIVPFAVVPFGKLPRSEAYLAIGQANQVQRSFHFEFSQKLIHLDLQQYWLPNSGYDLDRAAEEQLKNTEFPKPLILLTSLPYGDTDHGTEPGYFYFADYEADFDPEVMIISSFLWDKKNQRRLQSYILMSLATAVLSYCAGLELHDESHGCFLDYCDDPDDVERCMNLGRLCDSCENSLQSKLRDGRISVQQIAAAKRLYNRAVGQKVCFVIMPFDPKLKRVYEVASKSLREKGWRVVRADEMPHPRRITDAIIQAIFLSDLVLADLTGSNPNVFYELGVAHASNADVVLLTQDSTIPFDVTTERAIIYKPSRVGLQKLNAELQQFVGPGSW